MKKRSAQFVVAVLSVGVMAEALYWPIIRKPGTPLEWWQNFYLAKTGQYVGFPAWLVLLNSSLHGTFQVALAWILILGWAAVLYWLIGTAIDLMQKRRRG
ncbi:MAG TPA: hypothetical protein VIU93_01800 [Gallionellaceae bacterium]